MKLCGFVHSIFVRRPVPVIGLFASYSAPNEWWASNGAAKHETRVKAANIPRVIILLWVLRYLTHYRRRSKQVCPCSKSVALDELQNEQCRRTHLLDTVNRCNVVMVQRRQNLRFTLKAAQPIGLRAEPVGENLPRVFPAL